MFASTKGGGVCFAFPDVCQVPAPPAPPIPTPFPNIGQCPMAQSAATKVKIQNQPVLTTKSKIPRSNGDEAGVAGGVMSGTFGDQIQYALGSASVKVEGSPVVTLLKMTKHNGSNANAPAGAQIAPSQTQVLVL